MRKTIFLLAVALAGVAAPAHSAVVVGFGELAHDTETWGILNVASPYVSGGLLFKSEGGFLAYDGGRDYNADPVGTTLAGAIITVKRADGGLFDLASLQLAGAWNSSYDVGPIAFTFTDGAGVTSSSTFTLNRGLGLRTFTANRLGIASFTIDGSNVHGGPIEGAVQIDNVTYTPLAVTAVPEPAAWAMMIGGFGLIGISLRRRGRIRIAYA